MFGMDPMYVTTAVKGEDITSCFIPGHSRYSQLHPTRDGIKLWMAKGSLSNDTTMFSHKRTIHTEVIRRQTRSHTHDGDR